MRTSISITDLSLPPSIRPSWTLTYLSLLDLYTDFYLALSKVMVEILCRGRRTPPPPSSLLHSFRSPTSSVSIFVTVINDVMHKSYYWPLLLPLNWYLSHFKEISNVCMCEFFHSMRLEEERNEILGWWKYNYVKTTS